MILLGVNRRCIYLSNEVPFVVIFKPFLSFTVSVVLHFSTALYFIQFTRLAKKLSKDTRK